MSRVYFGLLVLVLAGPLAAAEGPTQRNTTDRQIIDLLARVHDQGAALFNAGDHAGCYRMFQGSLVTAKLVLPKELQDAVDRGLSRAEMATGQAQRALALHDVIEDVRKKLHPTAGKPEPLPPPKKSDGMADTNPGFKPVSPIVPGVPEPQKRMDPPKVAIDPPKMDPPKVAIDPPKSLAPTKPPADSIETPKLPAFNASEPPIAPAKPGRLNIPDSPPPVISGVPTSNPKPAKPMPEPLPSEPLSIPPRPVDPAPTKPADPLKLDDPPPLKIAPLPLPPMSDALDPPGSKAPTSPAPPSGIPDLGGLIDPPPMPKPKPKDKPDAPPPLTVPK